MALRSIHTSTGVSTGPGKRDPSSTLCIAICKLAISSLALQVCVTPLYIKGHPLTWLRWETRNIQQTCAVIMIPTIVQSLLVATSNMEAEIALIRS